MTKSNQPIRKKLTKEEEKNRKNRRIAEKIRRTIEGIDWKGNKLKETLSDEQKKVAWDYYKSLNAGDGAKITSMISVESYIRPIVKFGLYSKKPYDKIEKQDIINWVSYLQDEHERQLSQTTVSYYRFMIKLFYRWFYETGKDYPKLVEWIPEKTNAKRIIDDSVLLTNSEIKQMIKVMDNDRDKAIIIVIYEGGLRVGELEGIRLRDVILKDGYCEIKVDGKTGERILPLIDAMPYVEKWINNHPFKSDKESPLFINFSSNKYGNALKRTGVNGILKKAKERAGLDKKVFPHLLRHSKFTHMGEQGYNERDLRLYGGWSENSKMPSVYLHYGYDGLKNKILTKKNRLSNEEKARQIREQNANLPKECPRCKRENPSDALYCNCGMALDLRTVERELKRRQAGDEILNKIVNDPLLSQEFAKLLDKAKSLT